MGSDQRPWTRADRFSRNALMPSLVVIEAAPRLAAQPPRGDVLAEDRGRPVLVVPELAVEHLRDEQARVEPDEVGERERAHRMIEAELHAGVDVRRRREPLVERE